MDLTAIVGDQTWQTPGWPLLLSVGNAGLSLVLSALLVLMSRQGGLGQRAGGITLGGGGAGGGGHDWSTGAPIPESEIEAGASWAPRAPVQGSGAKPPSALRRAGGADLGGIHE